MKKRTKIIIISVAAVALIAVIGALIYYFAVALPEQKQQQEWQEMMQNYYDSKCSSFKDENEQYADYEVDVAFIGDSLTDGYDVKAAYPQYTVVNRGISGDTTFGLEDRLQVSLYDLKPKVVVMLIGANNFGTMFENYEDILIGLQENLPESEVVLVSLTSMSKEWGKNNQLAAYNNVKIKLLAEKYGYEYVDLYSALLDIDKGEIQAEYTTDGGHLTAEGYAVFTKTITPVLEELDCLKKQAE